MRRMRGVLADGGNDNKMKTVLLIYNEEKAWIRFGREAEDYPVSQEEVRELSKIFRQCIEGWDLAKKKAGK